MDIIGWWIRARIYESMIPHQDLQTELGREVNRWLVQYMYLVANEDANEAA